MHAIIQPSSAHRWVNCPGSVHAQQQYPDDETEAAREGTASHWVGEQVLLNRKSGDTVLLPSEFIDKTAPNGVIITEEMADGAQAYVNDVMRVCDRGGYIPLMQIEETVMIERVHALNWGTPDCRIWLKDKGHLIVWDYKFGRVPVENRENWQLIDYAIGALDEITGGNSLKDQVITIELRIVQPRAFHVDGICREWTIKGDELRTYANQLKTAAELSQIEEPPTTAGDWCKNCTASVDCLTLQRASADVADKVEVLQLHNLSPSNAAIELRYLRKAQRLVEERLKALEVQSMEQIKNGTLIPGWSIGSSRSSTAWTTPDAEVIMLGDLLGIQLRKPEAPITPTQAKKLNVDDAVINSYCKKHQGKAILVTDNNTIAGRVFSK